MRFARVTVRGFLLLITLLTVPRWGAHSAAAAPISGKLGTPVQLFNGKDLSGWTWVARPPKAPATQSAATIEEVWSVEAGVLHSAGRPIGYLRTDRTFPPHYLLTIEYRHLAKGNGGFLFAVGGPDKVWPRCLECQGQFGSVGDIRNTSGIKVTADESRIEQQGKQIHRLVPNAEHPLGEWNTVQIVVDGPDVRIIVNDQLQNKLSGCADLTGHIALQAEGAAMDFRRIELTPIESP